MKIELTTRETIDLVWALSHFSRSLHDGCYQQKITNDLENKIFVKLINSISDEEIAEEILLMKARDIINDERK